VQAEVMTLGALVLSAYPPHLDEADNELLNALRPEDLVVVVVMKEFKQLDFGGSNTKQDRALRASLDTRSRSSKPCVCRTICRTNLSHS
jgi:hypothetical protein